MSKKSLKKTVVLSALSIVISAAMLIGVTYAVFNDKAETGVNTITAGTIDIALLNSEGNSVERTVENPTATVNFVGNQPWEPEGTYNLEPLTIKNNGDLSLVYKIDLKRSENSNPLDQYVTLSVIVDGNAVDLDTFNAETNNANRTLAPGEEVTVSLAGTLSVDTPASLMGASAGSISIAVLAKQTTANAAYPDA